jgi:hypothetical protein
MNDVQVQNQKLDETPYPFSVEDVIDEEGVLTLEI